MRLHGNRVMKEQDSVFTLSTTSHIRDSTFNITQNSIDIKTYFNYVLRKSTVTQKIQSITFTPILSILLFLKESILHLNYKFSPIQKKMRLTIVVRKVFIGNIFNTGT